MWKKKKVVLLAALAVAVLIGGIAAGIGFAQTGSVDNSQPKSQFETLLDKVGEIYKQNTGVAIDVQQLKDAFAQASSDMQIEALKSRLQALVDQGKLTQDQADQYLKWWQARPDTPLLGPGGHGFGGHGFRGGI